MQKVTNIDQEIKKYSQKLKELVAQKKGISVEELEKLQKIKEKKLKICSFGFQRFYFHFKCPNCSSYRTKRVGKTTQVNVKARYICKDCRDKRIKKKDNSVQCFFTLNNEDMKKQIMESKNSDEDKELFLEKYLIKDTNK